MSGLAEAIDAMPVLSQWMLAGGVLGGVVTGISRWHGLRAARAKDTAEASRMIHAQITMIAGDNATQIVSTGGWLGTPDALHDTFPDPVDWGRSSPGGRPPPDRSWAHTVRGSAPAAKVAALPGPTVDTWCAGCDRLMATRWMAWDDAGLYRCRACRGQGEVTDLEQRLVDVADAATPDSAATMLPIIASVPGSLVDQVLRTEPTPVRWPSEPSLENIRGTFEDEKL